jgi:hypothetical protein
LSIISEIVLKECSSVLGLIVDELVNKTKDKKEDADWEGIPDKFKTYEEIMCNILLKN